MSAARHRRSVLKVEQWRRRESMPRRLTLWSALRWPWPRLEGMRHCYHYASSLPVAVSSWCLSCRGTRAYTATLEQQQITRFIEEQQLRVKCARQRAAECRDEAAQVSRLMKESAARKVLAEKKALCNKVIFAGKRCLSTHASRWI